MMSRQRSKWLVPGLFLFALWMFHSRYEIILRNNRASTAQRVDGGGSGSDQQAAQVHHEPAVVLIEPHVGAEDPAGHLFIPKLLSSTAADSADRKPMDRRAGARVAGEGGASDSGDRGDGRHSQFLRRLRHGQTWWMYCAKQYHNCTCAGTIRWGRGGPNGKWSSYPLAESHTQHTLECSINALPDILPGVDAKHCECEMSVGSSVYEAITNPGMLPPMADADLSPLVMSSCSIIEGMGAGPTSLPDSICLWRAAEPLCSAAWSSSGAASAEATGAVSGDRAFTLEETRASMLAWVDELFEESIERLYDGAGWLPQAFLTYFAGPPDGKHAKMVEMLVVSVHEFSQVPIVVMHFGMCAPADWTPKRFPRMVLIHMGPLPGDSGRSFNFNKIRAMITARIRVGVQLDADQFVAPGVDALFQLTEKECTRAYPMPLMPSHFAERGPGMVEERLLSRAGGKYWERYCPGDPTNLSRFCTYQTTRWGHAHPTWTFWALPFLGRWLRMNFRDETLPRRVRDEDMGELGVMSALRIVIVPEDEDLLNIGLWEEGGTKQLCKIDQAGVDDFNALLNGADSSSRCTHPSKCGNIVADERFHPLGVAKAFYTAHHAVDPYKETPSFIERLKAMKSNHTLPPPILFNGRFYPDGATIKREFPAATCLI